MNILEFIRKNSILVVIVIAGIALGLIMSEYGNKGDQLAGDMAFQVNDRSYNAQEVGELSSYAERYFQELIYAAPRRLRNLHDSDGDGKLTAAEEEAYTKAMTDDVAAQTAMQALENAYKAWQYGFANQSAINIATNRVIIQEEGKALGILPSKEQVDAYIQNMPIFKQPDGSFDQQLYRRLAGYTSGRVDNIQERYFRQFIADLMVWQALQHLLVDGMELDSRAAVATLNISLQDISVKSAWLPSSAVPAIKDPSEEEIKAYWQVHKNRYLSDAQRVVSLYTLTPAEGISIEELYATSEQLMQTIAESNQADIDQMLATASQNPELAPFTYKAADGKTHQSFTAYTQAQIPAELSMEIEGARGSSTLGGLAFEVEAAPSFEDHSKNQKEGVTPRTNIKQLRGFFPTPEGKLVLLRVDAQLQPGVLPFESAKEMAKTDLIKELKLKALTATAEELNKKVGEALAKEGVDQAFALATAAGASVEDVKGINPETPTGLPVGMDSADLLTVASGQLAPLQIVPEQGARITAVTGRVYSDSPELSNIRDTMLLPQLNQIYRDKIMLDWIHQSYKKMNVGFAEQYTGQK